MCEYVRKTKLLYHNGREALKILLVYPNITDCHALTAFYSKLARNCLEWCEKVEYPKLCGLLENQSNARQDRYNYSFKATLVSVNEDIAEISLEIIFYKYLKEPISHYNNTQFWSLSHGMMCKKPREKRSERLRAPQ